MEEVLRQLVEREVLSDYSRCGEFPVFLTPEFSKTADSEDLLLDDLNARAFVLVGRVRSIAIPSQELADTVSIQLFLNELNDRVIDSGGCGFWQAMFDCEEIAAGEQPEHPVFQMYFHYVLTVLKDFQTEDMVALLENGVETYRNTAGRLRAFLRRREKDKAATPSVRFHPQMIDLLMKTFGEE